MVPTHRKSGREREPDRPRDPEESRLSTRAFVRGLVMILASTLTGVGLAYLLGPTPTTASLVAMGALLDAVGGMRAWGALLVIAALLVTLRQYLIGHSLACLVLLIWAGCSAVSIMQGTASAASGPATIGGWAVIHAWMLYAHRASRWSP
jgi:hypothetical protein